MPIGLAFRFLSSPHRRVTPSPHSCSSEVPSSLGLTFSHKLSFLAEEKSFCFESQSLLHKVNVFIFLNLEISEDLLP
jgi:hypothetical protein